VRKKFIRKAWHEGERKERVDEKGMIPMIFLNKNDQSAFGKPYI
jgi:hypothetical protein